MKEGVFWSFFSDIFGVRAYPPVAGRRSRVSRENPEGSVKKKSCRSAGSVATPEPDLSHVVRIQHE